MNRWLPKALGILAFPMLANAPALAADTVYNYYPDTLHSAAAITDASGNVVERTQYAPYGLVLNRLLRDGPAYTGQYEDPATGLDYMQQRYYDPQSGRFVSTDPVLPADDGGISIGIGMPRTIPIDIPIRMGAMSPNSLVDFSSRRRT